MIPPTLVAYFAYVQARKAKDEARLGKDQAIQTHLSVNSRMDELLRMAKLEATAQATLDEKIAQSVREGEAAVAKAKDADKLTPAKNE